MLSDEELFFIKSIDAGGEHIINKMLTLETGYSKISKEFLTGILAKRDGMNSKEWNSLSEKKHSYYFETRKVGDDKNG